jgi:putative hydrolase of the HAD superfamily
MELKAVFFDMGGTIQTYSTSQEMRINNVPLLRDCLSRGGIHFKFTDEQLADTISSGISSYHKWNRKSLIELSPLEVWMKFVLRDNPVSKEVLEPIAEELSYLYETQFYERKMRPEIPQVLDRIKEMGLKIGCISNTQSQCQVPDNLKEYGILEFFDPIVLSSVYGLRKPDASIFYHAAQDHQRHHWCTQVWLSFGCADPS